MRINIRARANNKSDALELGMNEQGLFFRFLSEEDLIGSDVLDMGNCVETIEEVFELVAKGDYLMGGPSHNDHGLMMWFPQTANFPHMPTAGPDRRFMSMMAYLGGDFHVIGEKWYGSNIANHEKGLPRSIHTITLNDVETGSPIAFMSGNLISAMRTGAVAGVAARHLSAPSAQIAAIIGAGVISRACARAIIYATPNINHLKIYDLNLERAQALATELADEFSVQVQAVDTLQTAVEKSDVISVATSGSVSPTIEEAWIKPGALIALTGNTTMNAKLYQKSRIVVDNWAMHKVLYQDGLSHPNGLQSILSWAMSADLLRLLDSGQLDEQQIQNLGSLMTDTPKTQSENQTTIFISGGMPVEDVAWAHRVYRRAVQQDLGQTLRLWEAPRWS